MFIQIEGVDGVGKTTQCTLLRDWVVNTCGSKAVIVKELESTDLGRNIKTLLSEGNKKSSMAEMFLFLASKSQATSESIMPALARGECVIGDRGHGSFISYNASLGIDRDLLIDLLGVASFGITPDITILLDLPLEVIQLRLDSKIEKSRFDTVNKIQLDRQKKRFLELATTMPNWVVVNGDQEVEEVHRLITEEVKKVWG